MNDEFKPGDRLVYMGDGKWQKEHFEEAREEVRLAWRDLTVAAAELGASLARFENAMDAFKDTKPYGDRCISMNGNHEQCILAYRHSGRHQFDETHRDVKPRERCPSFSDGKQCLLKQGHGLGHEYGNVTGIT